LFFFVVAVDSYITHWLICCNGLTRSY